MRILLAALLLAFPLLAGARECRYSAAHNLDVAATGLHAVTLELGSSDTVVEGVRGLDHIEVRGRACAASESGLDGFAVRQERHEDDVTVVADSGHRGVFSGLFGERYMTLHVRVPANLAVVVRSGSADVEASDLAALDFGSGSGDLQARHIAGLLRLQLGSADAVVADAGRVELRSTGSGDVHIDGVRGDVRAGHSGSGDLGFSHVAGSVRVAGTGSGDVSARHVKGAVQVGSTGSGDVDVHDVGGDFTVGSVGSGDVNYSDVRGHVSVPHDDD